GPSRRPGRPKSALEGRPLAGRAAWAPGHPGPRAGAATCSMAARQPGEESIPALAGPARWGLDVSEGNGSRIATLAWAAASGGFIRSASRPGAIYDFADRQ